MNETLGAVAKLVLLTALLVGLPLLGITVAGKPWQSYLHFPPDIPVVQHAMFSTTVFTVLSIVEIGLVASLAYMAFPRMTGAASPPPRRRSFPGWGWFALILLGGMWTLAWSRFSWFRTLQPFTFTPLWISYILVVNALSYRRTGRCLMIDRPGLFFAMFPTSALFWWYFEYLNRFVQNWHYIGTTHFDALTYILHSTFAFSTVIPAVASTTQYLQSFPPLQAGLGRPLRLRRRRAYAGAALGVAAGGLLGIGVWPSYLFPLLWVAPLLILVALQVIFGQRSYFSDLTVGRWQLVYLPAFAALVCGFFWEMWNYHSYAKWIYHIPFAERLRIFEMPLLGYAGYLPFGLECAVIANLLDRILRRPAQLIK